MASLSYSLAPMSFKVEEKAPFDLSLDETTSINKVDNDDRATTSTMTNSQTSRETSNNNNNNNKSSPSRRNRVAFGSCNEQDFQNNLWPIIEERKPDAFIWGGDAIYADEQLAKDYSTFPPRNELKCATPERLRTLYERQQQVPSYQRLLWNRPSSTTKPLPIFGCLDDHDYGCNNADRTFEYRLESAMAFVDFLGMDRSSAMYQRAQAGHGVYGVMLLDFNRPNNDNVVPEHEALIDPDVVTRIRQNHSSSSTDSNNNKNNNNNNETTYYESDRSVAIFVLDVRSNKTPWKKGLVAFLPDYEGDFLGERQWQWFEQALANSRASVNIVVNGLQVHSNRFPDGNVAEAWGKYPRAQQRLFDALLQPTVQSPVLVSGDVHMAQLMRKDCVRRQDLRSDGSRSSKSHARRSLVEMTTSGMTHSWSTTPSPRNDFTSEHQISLDQRVGVFLSGKFMTLLHYICPWTDLMISSQSEPAIRKERQQSETGVDNDSRVDKAQESEEEDYYYVNGGGEGAQRGLQFSLLRNFGEIEIDWDARSIALRIWGEDNWDPHRPPLLMANYSMDELTNGYAFGTGVVVDRNSTSTSPLAQTSQVDRDAFLAELMHAEANQVHGDWICVNYRGQENIVLHLLGHLASGVVLSVPLLIPSILVALLTRRIFLRAKSNNKAHHGL